MLFHDKPHQTLLWGCILNVLGNLVFIQKKGTQKLSKNSLLLQPGMLRSF